MTKASICAAVFHLPMFAIKPQPCLSEAGDGYLLFRIGDCVAQRNTHAAIYDALRLCKDF